MSRIEELEKRLAADPGSRIFVQLAEEYRKAGLLEQAIEVCEEGLKKHPHYPSARVALGRALLEAETFERAGQEFEAVLAQIPDNILANKFLAETYHRLGRFDEALQKYNVAKALAPEDNEIQERMRAVETDKAGGGQPLAPPPISREEPAAEAEEKTPEPTVTTPVRREAGPNTPSVADLPPIPLAAAPEEPMVLEGAGYHPQGTPEGDDLRPEPTLVETPLVEAAPLPEPYEPNESERTVLETPPSPGPAPPTPQFSAEPPAVLSVVEPERETPSRDAPVAGPSVGARNQPEERLETPTMAEIYASQGHLTEAVKVYRNLLARHPEEAHYQHRIEELEMLASAAADPGTPAERAANVAGDRRETIRVLEGWLDAVRKSRGA